MFCKNKKKSKNGFTPLEKASCEACDKILFTELNGGGALSKKLEVLQRGMPLSAHTPRRHSSLTGFTLIELLIACIIIGVLVTIAYPSYLRARLRAERAKAIAALYAIYQCEKEYWFDIDDITGTERQTYANLVLLDAEFPDVMGEGDEDGDWVYSTVDAGANTFTIQAEHLDRFGAPDGIILQINQNGDIAELGSWP